MKLKLTGGRLMKFSGKRVLVKVRCTKRKRQY